MRVILNFIKNLIRYILRIFDIELSKIKEETFPVELSPSEIQILKTVQPFTMTSLARLSTLAIATKYINTNNISGDLVECGVWAGGSIAAAINIDRLFNHDREYWLYDTFDGMTKPSINDSKEAHSGYEMNLSENGKSTWCSVSESQVKENLKGLNIDLQNCHFVPGDVATTLKQTKPTSIALLRLDTDWYESTKVELQELWPLLSVGGILILDDYGYWQGARSAVEEYFNDMNIQPLLIPIDRSGRICVKQSK